MHLNVKFECTKMYTGNVINAKILKLYVLMRIRGIKQIQNLFILHVYSMLNNL